MTRSSWSSAREILKYSAPPGKPDIFCKDTVNHTFLQKKARFSKQI